MNIMVNPTDKMPGDESYKPEIIVLSPTVEQEVARVDHYVKALDNPEMQGVDLVFPKGLDVQGRTNLQDAETLSRAEFDSSFYSTGMERVQADVPRIQEAVTVLAQYQEAWGFTLPEAYSITLSRYGTGGSCSDIQKGRVIMRTNDLGRFSRPNPAGTPIHEITHMCIQHLDKEFNLSFKETEELVKFIDRVLFPDIFDPNGIIPESKRLEGLAMLSNLPEYIAEIKKKSDVIS